MSPSKYFGVATWTLLAAAWLAIILTDASSQAIGGMMILTVIAMFVTHLTSR